MHTQMHGARWLLLLLLSAGASHCGGPAFSSSENGAQDGGSGGEGSAPVVNAGATSEGGDDTTGPAQGGSTAVDPTDVPGEAGAGGRADIPAGSAGAGGTAGEDPPVVLDLTECGADAFGVGIMPTLYSTLDSAPAITLPAIGQLGFVGNGEGDYHGDKCGTGINIDQAGDYIKYHYQDNQVRHFDPLTGTMDFWYMPSYSHTDGLNHHLFSTANWATAGGIRIRKAAADNLNAFQVIVRGAALEQVLQIEVPADEYSLTPAEWTRITLVWYLAPNLPERYLRLFIDSQLVGELLPPVTFQMAPDPNGFFVLGVWDFGDAEHAAGILDDFKVFPRGP